MPNKQLFMICDLLGFKEFVCNYTGDIKSLGNDYLKVTAAAIMAHGYDDDTNQFDASIITFSDTFCYVSPSEMPAKRFIRTASLLLYNSIINDDPFLPVRGAIGYGEIIFEKNKELLKDDSLRVPIVLGKPLVEAHILEQQQNWIGISTVPTQIDEFEKEQADTFNEIVEEKYLVKYDVPCKGKTVTTNAVNFASDSIKLSKMIKRCKSIGDKQKRCSNIKLKYKNTIRYMEYLAQHEMFFPRK